jgi:MFS transporter, ACS family, hexuronate transporter
LATETQATFVSYSRDDSDFALRLIEDLKSAGASVWLDQLDIKPGQRWARAVQDALTASPRMLVILSPSSVESTNVDDEISFALEEHKTVIPVLYRDCKIPFRLRPYQHVDFRTDYARGLKILLNNLGTEKPSQITQAPPQETPPSSAARADRQASVPIPTTQDQPSSQLRPEAKQTAPRKPEPEQKPASPPPIQPANSKATVDTTPSKATILHQVDEQPVSKKSYSSNVAFSPTQEKSLDSQSSFPQWRPSIAIFLLTILGSMGRNLITSRNPMLSSSSLPLSATQYGYAILAVSLCYMLAGPIWGYWIDRRGPWRPTLIAVIVWSLVLAILNGGAIIPNGLFGLALAVVFPAAMKTVTETLHPVRRSFGLGIIYSGVPLATILAPLVIQPISFRFGWRFGSLLLASLSLIWIAVWFILRKNLSASADQSSALENSRWKRNLFANAAVYGLGAAPITFSLSFIPGMAAFSHIALTHLLWLPSIGWIAGYLFFGKFADRVRPRGIRPQKLFFIFSIVELLLIPLRIAAFNNSSVIGGLVILFTQMFLGAGFIAFALSDGMATLPKQRLALFAGICVSTLSLITMLLQPILYPLFNPGGNRLASLIIGILPLIGTVLWKILATPPTHHSASAPSSKVHA